MNPKLRALAQRIQADEEALVDYETIAGKAQDLGIPLSVRTLRFYVSEGILPPPRKQGKTPVYPEDWILGALLALHLMKTRFHLSLAEIRAVFEGLTGAPETLAERCVELYELSRESGGSLTPPQHRWVVRRFFARLLGAGDGAESDLPPSAPEDVSLQALAREAAGLPPAELLSVRPIQRQTIQRQEPGQLGRQPRAPAAGSAVAPDGAGAVRPLDGLPACTCEEARERENIFIRHFERAFANVTAVYHPFLERPLAVKATDLKPAIADDYQEVARVLLEHRFFDRELFDRMPLQKSTRFDIDIDRRVQKLSVVALSWSPIVDLVPAGAAGRRFGSLELEEILAPFLAQESRFFYLGILAPCGLAADFKESREGSLPAHFQSWKNLRVALAEYCSEKGWCLWHNFPAEASSLLSVFDPETHEEKLDRMQRRLLALDVLGTRGGFIELAVLEAEWCVGRSFLEEAARRLTEQDSRFLLQKVNGRRILKRDRLS